MLPRPLYCAGSTPAVRYASEILAARGIPIVHTPQEHDGYVLLDVPSFDPTGALRGGGRLEELLSVLADDAVLCGGNLNHPLLEGLPTVDLLRDEEYLARNAAITAQCAVQIAASLLPITLAEAPTLILGWGRIGKCLARLLKDLGAEVTVTARRSAHRAMLLALGYGTAEASALDLRSYRLIINTVPAPLLTRAQLEACPRAVKLDLASRRGLPGPDAVWARGLPGIHAPESSGRLIADTLTRLWKEEIQ
ncbi:MAG: hypothetical protein ACI4PL_00665 [Faecousia sp.]